jgi:hypothetical protein
MLQLENAKVTNINLSTQGTTATVTLTLSSLSDDDLAALLAMANKHVVGSLEALRCTQPAG